MRNSNQGRISSLEKTSGGSFRQSKRKEHTKTTLFVVLRHDYLLFCGYWTIQALTDKNIEENYDPRKKLISFLGADATVAP